MYELSKDEIFILGNIGIAGVLLNRFDLSAPMIEMLQTERPENAAGFVAEALYLNSLGDFDEAVTLLETSGALQADVNLDEALGTYVFSLYYAGEQERASEFAQALLADGVIQSDDTKRSLSEIVELYETQQS